GAQVGHLGGHSLAIGRDPGIAENGHRKAAALLRQFLQVYSVVKSRLIGNCKTSKFRRSSRSRSGTDQENILVESRPASSGVWATGQESGSVKQRVVDRCAVEFVCPTTTPRSRSPLRVSGLQNLAGP